MPKIQKLTTPLYSRLNYTLLALAIGVILIGYYCLAQKPRDGVLTMVVAPFLLISGYCVLLPIAIFIRAKRKKGLESEAKSTSGD